MNTFSCRVYGHYTVTHYWFEALYHSDAIERLRGISQYGHPPMLQWIEPVTRLEHSLGVMWLTHLLGGTDLEQIAALVHDAAHGPCSHVLDGLYPKHSSPHDTWATSLLSQTTLPSTLETIASHQRWTTFFDRQRWPIHIQPSPALSADRVDNILRDALAAHLRSNEQIQPIIQTLRIQNQQMGVQTIEAAIALVEIMRDLNEHFYCHPRNIGIYHHLANIINLLITHQNIDAHTLWNMTDAQLWRLLEHSQDKNIIETLALFEREHDQRQQGNPSLFVLRAPEQPPPRQALFSGTVHVRYRQIDPHVITPDGVNRASSEHDHVASTLKQMTQNTGAYTLWTRS